MRIKPDRVKILFLSYKFMWFIHHSNVASVNLFFGKIFLVFSESLLIILKY